jgi:sulfofructose kinase
MKKCWDVLGLGAVAVDDLVYVDHYPAVDTKEPIREWARQGGGLAGTALVTVARLGMRAAYFGCLGEEELSQFTRLEFIREGVDVTPIISIPDARPIHSIVIIEKPTGSRTLFFDVAGLQAPPLGYITPDLINKTRVLFVDHTLPVAGIKAAKLARTMGIPVVADIEASARAEDDLRIVELVELVDHLVIGIEMAQHLSGREHPGEAAHEILNQGHQAVVVTVGDQGSWFCEERGNPQHQPALKVAVVDTVGCGDVFHGAYTASLAKGMQVSDAVKIATIAAGLKATKPGGRTGIPNWKVIDPYFRNLCKV